MLRWQSFENKAEDPQRLFFVRERQKVSAYLARIFPKRSRGELRIFFKEFIGKSSRFLLRFFQKEPAVARHLRLKRGLLEKLAAFSSLFAKKRTGSRVGLPVKIFRSSKN